MKTQRLSFDHLFTKEQMSEIASCILDNELSSKEAATYLEDWLSETIRKNQQFVIPVQEIVKRDTSR